MKRQELQATKASIHTSNFMKYLYQPKTGLSNDGGPVCLPMLTHRRYKTQNSHRFFIYSTVASASVLLSSFLLALETIRDPEFGKKPNTWITIFILGFLGSIGVIRSALYFYEATTITPATNNPPLFKHMV